MQTHGGGRVRWEWGAELSGRLRVWCREQGVTLHMALVAAFGVLLWRLNGERDVVVGTAVAGRDRRELEAVVGLFVNLLPLRVRVDGGESFAQLAVRVRETALEAYGHQEVPFEKLVEELSPERALSHHPVFQTMVLVQNTPVHSAWLEGLRTEWLEVEGTTSKFDLMLAVVERERGIAGSLEYATDLFEQEQMEKLMGQLERLLERVLGSPERALGEIGLLDEEERRRVLEECSGAALDGIEGRSLRQWLDQAGEQHRERIAVEDAEGTRWTYGELHARAEHLADHLAVLGAGPERMVGVCLERSAEMALGLVGVVKTGAAYLPLDPLWPRARLAEVVGESRPVAVLTMERWRSPLEAVGCRVLTLDGDWRERAAPARPLVATDPDHLAYVIYTSGSTGRPKGVAVTQQAVARLAQGSFAEWGPEQTFLQLAPLSFDASTLELWCCLLHGSRLVVAPRGVLSTGEIAELVEHRGVSTLWLTADLLGEVVEAELEHLGGVSQLLAGGDVLPPKAVGRLRQRWPQQRSINGYGPTEGTTFSCCYRIGEEEGAIPIGRPIEGTQAYVLDAAQEPAGIGVTGELYLGGAGLARGYWGDASLTAEKFVPNPFGSSGSRLYRTGDLARWRGDGNLEFLGRRDRQAKVRGYRIEMGEIEAALSGHPGVFQAVVEVRHRQLVAYVMGGAGLPDWGLAAAAAAGLSCACAVGGGVPFSAHISRQAGPRRAAGSGACVRRGGRAAAHVGGGGAGGSVAAGAGVGADSSPRQLLRAGRPFPPSRARDRGIRAVFQVAIPLRMLFDNPVLADLAIRIEDLLLAEMDSQ